jgi:cytidylate kinase
MFMSLAGYPDIIAIDGPAASGKSTLALKLAHDLGYLYFDTGVMYRAVTLAALRSKLDVEDAGALTRLAESVQIDVRPASIPDGRTTDIYLDGEDVTWDIRSHAVDANVSVVSAHRGVRQALTAQQRRIGLRGKVVMVGRDIGTVVLPEADLKIYLDASVEERARRRYNEMRLRGGQATYDEILQGMRRRDQIDSSRDVAPIKAAEDAVILHSGGKNADQVFAEVKKLLAEVASH